MTKATDRLKSFHVIARLHNEAEQIIVLGETLCGCLCLAERELTTWTHEELRTLDSAWVEQWIDNGWDKPRWVPQREISLKKFKLRASAREQHARRKGISPTQV